MAIVKLLLLSVVSRIHLKFLLIRLQSQNIFIRVIRPTYFQNKKSRVGESEKFWEVYFFVGHFLSEIFFF